MEYWQVSGYEAISQSTSCWRRPRVRVGWWDVLNGPSLAAKLDKYALAAVLHRREPRWLQRDLRTFNVGLVFAMDVRRHSLEARKAHKRKDLTQAMELNHSLDAVAPRAGAKLQP